MLLKEARIMKTLSLLGLIVGLVILVLSPSVYADQPLPMNRANWMSHLQDNLFLSRVTIPGTHDSGADKHTSQVSWPEWHYVITQDFRIANQLKLGVRWLDIRLRYFQGGLTVHHEDFYLHKNFNDILNISIDFLRYNPSETVILMIKQEYSKVSSEKFGNRVLDHIKAHGLDNFFLEDRVPTVGEVRGKIYIVRQFKNHTGQDFGPYFWWPNQSTGEYVHRWGGIEAVVQDKYEMSGAEDNHKLDLVKNLIFRAGQNPPQNRFYLNFVSGEDVPSHTLWTTSDWINREVEKYLNARKHWRSNGIIMINFAGGGDKDNGRDGAWGLVDKILQRNDGL